MPLRSSYSVAYMDAPVLIGHGQTISQAFILAAVKFDDTLLEVGAGSGYQSRRTRQIKQDECLAGAPNRADDILSPNTAICALTVITCMTKLHAKCRLASRDPELIARNLDGFDRERPSLLAEVHLLDWNSGRQIWPPPGPSMAAAFAATFCQPVTPPTWRTTTTGVPRRSSGSDSIWLTTMRARLGSKRNAKIERRGNVSLRASAREHPRSALPSHIARERGRTQTMTAGWRRSSRPMLRYISRRMRSATPLTISAPSCDGST